MYFMHYERLNNIIKGIYYNKDSLQRCECMVIQNCEVKKNDKTRRNSFRKWFLLFYIHSINSKVFINIL